MFFVEISVEVVVLGTGTNLEETSCEALAYSDQFLEYLSQDIMVLFEKKQEISDNLLN